MGIIGQNVGNPGGTHHIMASSNRRSTEQRLPPIAPKVVKGRAPDRVHDMPRIGYPDSITVGIPTQRRGGILVKVHQRSLGNQKNRTEKLESLVSKLNHRAHIIPPVR